MAWPRTAPARRLCSARRRSRRRARAVSRSLPPTRRGAAPPARSRRPGPSISRRPTPPLRRSGCRATARPSSPPGGGTIASAGNAIEFLGGSNQTATFDNFTINNPSGDLVFADPSTATINFNTTTANAGSGNLLNATAGSAVTFNANASTLTGAISTDPTSTSNVNLTNGDGVEPDRPVDGHQPRRHQQHRRLRAAERRRRLQDAHRHQLCRLRSEHHDERGARRIDPGVGPDRRQRRRRDRSHPADDQERERPRRADVRLRRSARHRDQRRHDRARRLRARRRPAVRGLSLHARPVGRGPLSRLDSGPDGRRRDQLRHQRRQGAAEPDHHQPGA